MAFTGKYTDEELISIIQHGPVLDIAIEYLYKTHFETLSTYVKHNQGSTQDAEDNFQEVIIAFLETVQKDKFRGESSIKTFLFSINKNMWLNELKRRDRTTVREEKFERNKAPVNDEITDLMVVRETGQKVIEVMNKLGELCKKILLAFYYDNQSMKEIVQTLNYENEQVLRNKKYKCLKQLEQILTADPILASTLKSALQNEQ